MRIITFGGKLMSSNGKILKRLDPTYNITVVQPEHATVSVSAQTGGVGDVITITSTVDDGYDVVNYTVNGIAIQGNTFTLSWGDVVVSAVTQAWSAELWYKNDTVYPLDPTGQATRTYINITLNKQHDLNYFTVRFKTQLAETHQANGWVSLYKDSIYGQDRLLILGNYNEYSHNYPSFSMINDTYTDGGDCIGSVTAIQSNVKVSSTNKDIYLSNDSSWALNEVCIKVVVDRSGRKEYYYMDDVLLFTADLLYEPLNTIGTFYRVGSSLKELSIAGFPTLAEAQAYNGTL